MPVDVLKVRMQLEVPPGLWRNSRGAAIVPLCTQGQQGKVRYGHVARAIELIARSERVARMLWDGLVRHGRRRFIFCLMDVNRDEGYLAFFKGIL